MLAIEIELLGGRYSATAYNDRGSAEWPPHPARFFSALVAVLHENEPVAPEEREALLWLEQQPAPSLRVCGVEDDRSGRRSVLNVAVPVNDLSVSANVEQQIRTVEAGLQELGQVGEGEGTPRERQKLQRERSKLSTKLAKLRAELTEIDAEPAALSVKTAAALLPHQRTRQMRTFPTVIPENPTFTFTWNVDVPAPVQRDLDLLCKRVTRLGHSSTLVRCIVTNTFAAANLVPSTTGAFVLRTVARGQLERLEREYDRHQGVESRILPAVPQRYDVARPETEERPIPFSMFSGEWIVFERVGGAKALSSKTTDLTRALRNSLIETHGSRTLPGPLSGHNPDGTPYNKMHVAFLALPFVGSEFADASVQGLAIVLPRDISPQDRESLLRLIATWESERGHADGSMELGGQSFPPLSIKRIDVPSKTSLRPNHWCRPSCRFVSATPIALDRNPGNLRSNQEHKAHKSAVEAQRTIADACEHIGLPRPTMVQVSTAPLLQGAQPAAAFLSWPSRQGRNSKVRAHAEIVFAEPVRGPVLLGAGRYFGLGLCLPLGESET